MARECWARQFGGCEGGLTREHLISKVLLGPIHRVRGLKWCEREFRTISKSSFVAKVLCNRHNNLLTDVDAEAGRFKAYLPYFFDAIPKPKRYDKTKYFFTLEGTLFARWICKTYCDLQAASDRAVNPDFAAYSFEQPGPPMYFFIPTKEGLPYKPDFRHIGTREFIGDDGEIILLLFFYGFRWIASNVDLSKQTSIVANTLGTIEGTDEVIDRPRNIYLIGSGSRFTPSRDARLQIEW